MFSVFGMSEDLDFAATKFLSILDVKVSKISRFIKIRRVSILIQISCHSFQIKRLNLAYSLFKATDTGTAN